MRRIHFVVVLLATLVTLAWAAPARAVQTELTIFIDLDNNPSTGCNDPTSGFLGYDQRVVSTVDTATGPNSALVTQIEGFDCSNTQIFFDGTDHPVGIGNGNLGLHVIETFWPFASLPPPHVCSGGTQGSCLRLGVFAENANGGTDTLFTTDGSPSGPTILFELGGTVEIPTLGEWGLLILALLLAGTAAFNLRRRQLRAALTVLLVLCAGGVAYAIFNDLDGTTISGWTPAFRVAFDPNAQDDGDDIAALYARRDQPAARVYFRIDASLVFNSAPTADPQSVTFNEDSSNNPITLTGTDPDSDPLTFTIVPGTGPNNGTLGGTPPNVTYTPNANYSGADAFDFQVDDGNGGTDTATISITVSGANDPPTLDPIADPAAINEDAGLQTVNLTGISAGPGEASQPLQVTAVSDNTAVIPNPTVTYTSPNATGSLSYTPVANASGTANVTVTVTDGGLDNNLGTAGDNGTTTDVFAVVVNAVNDPPTIDPIADPAAIPEDSGLQTINLTGISAGGAGTEVAQPLQVTAVSDNTAVIPNPTVTYTSPNATGSLDYTPVAGESGTANVTVTVTDGGLDNNLGTAGDNGTTTDVFQVVVNGVNDPPTIDPIADPAAINEDAGLQTVNLTGISAGPGEGSQPLQVTAVSDNTAVIPNPTVTYTSPNATGSLSYTPVANASGTANVTVTVTDGGLDNNLGTAGDNGTTTDVFQVVVNAVNDPPTLDPIADPAPLNEDAGLQTVNLTGISAGGAGTEVAQPLQVTAVSDNTAVIPNPTVTYTSPNATGSLSYTPVANASGTANVTVTVTDGGLDNNLGTAGDNGTTVDVFQVVVNAINDPPTLDPIADPAPLTEDAGLQTVNLTGISAGGAGSEIAQPLQVTAVSDNTAVIPNPTVTYTSPNATGSLSYTPVANTSGTANVTVTVTDGGLDNNLGTAGDNGTFFDVFQVVVNAVNDLPTLDPIADPAAINEDAGLQTVNLTGISAGPGEGSQPLQVTAVSDNTAVIPNPTVTYTSPNATGSLSYTPVANAFGTANVTVTVTDGGLDNNLGTAGDNASTVDVFQVVVNNVNDPPTLDPIADPAPINEDAGLQSVNLTGISAGGAGTEAAQPLQVTAVSDNTAVIPNPTVSYTSPNATGSLSYTPVANTAGTANVTVTVTDGGLDNNLGTAGDNATTVDVFQVVVNAINDPPTLDPIADPAPINEDAGLQTVNLTGISAGPGEGSQPLQVTVVSDNTAVIPNPTVTYTSPNATGSLSYTPVANAFGTANVTVTVTDGGLDNNLGTAGDNGTFFDVFQVVVNNLNDPPTLDPIPDPAAINEDAGLQTVNLTGITAGGGGTEIAQPLQVTAVSDNIGVIPNPAVSYTSPNATGSLSYTPVANAFGTANITVTVTDGGLDNNLGTAGDNASTVDVFQVVVNPVNDPPSFTTIPDPAAINEDAPQQTINMSGITAGPGEGAQPLQVTAVSDNTAVIPNPTVNYTSPNATGSLQYTPVANAFGTANVTVTLTDGGNDNNLGTAGDNLTFVDVFQVVVNPVNDPPVAGADSWDYIGNTELRVDSAAGATANVSDTTGSTDGVRDNDSDPVEGDATSVTSITVGACTDAIGPTLDCSDPAVGTVHMQSTGEFTFEPAPGDTGAAVTAGCTGTDQETFTYTLTDNGSPAPASAVGTVRLCRFARVWYVRNNAAAGNGTSVTPFNAITAANLSDNDGDGDLTDDLDSAGDYIFVYFGNGTASSQSAGLVLEGSQHLIGEHAGLSFNLNLNGNGVSNLVTAAPGNRPLLDDTVVDAFEGVFARNVIPVEVVGMNLAGNVNGLDWTTQAAFGGTGTYEVRDNVIRSAASEGIDVNLAGTGNTFLSLHDNNVTATGTGIDISETGTAALTLTAFDDNVVSGTTGGSGILVSTAIFDASATAGIQPVSGGTTAIGVSGDGVGGLGLSLASVTGALAFTDLDVFSAGTAVGAAGTGGFDLDVTSGAGQFVATAGPALSLSTLDAGIQNALLTSTTSTSGVSLTAVSGTVSASSGSSITKSSGGGAAYNVDNSAAGTTVLASTYNGTINNSSGTGRSVLVNNADSGSTVFFTGAVTDTGQGISLTTNTGASVRFSGGLALTTGANAAFAATGGGTVEVCDENPCNPGATGLTVNTITTTTGTALNVTATTIGANKLEFQSISAGTGASGPANGIRIDNTGNLGGLVVASTGAGACTSIGTCTGGAIRNTTSDGVYLNQTVNPSLTRMLINDSADSGIFVDAVSGLSLSNLFMDSNGAQAEGGAVQDCGIHIEDLIGASNTITNSTVQDSRNTNLDWDPNSSSGMSTLTVTGTNLNHAGEGVASQGNAGLNLVASGTADVKLVMSGGQVQNNAAAGILVSGGNGTTVRTDIDAVNMVSSAPPVDPSGASWGNGVGTNFGISLSSTGTAIQRHEVTNVQLAYTGIAVNDGGSASAIGFIPAGTGTFDLTLTGNTIGLVGAPRSGNENFFGIAGDIQDSPTVRLNVSNNIIRNTALNGIFIQTRDPSAIAGNVDADLTLRNNTVGPISDDDDFPFGAGPNQAETHATRVESRNDSDLCMDISANSSDGLGGNQDYLVRQRDTSTFRLERLAANTNVAATVETFIIAQNNPPAAQTARATVATTFTAVADGTCQNPLAP